MSIRGPTVHRFGAREPLGAPTQDSPRRVGGRAMATAARRDIRYLVEGGISGEWRAHTKTRYQVIFSPSANDTAGNRPVYIGGGRLCPALQCRSVPDQGLAGQFGRPAMAGLARTAER